MSAKHAKQAKEGKSRAGSGGTRGRPAQLHLGERLVISRIAKKARMDVKTVRKYLDMEGAPKPDDKLRYDFKEVVAWIEAHADRAATSSSEMRTLKEAILRTEAEERAFVFGIKKGEYIAIAKIEPAIAIFCQRLTADLRTKFENEMPDRCCGKNAIEIKEMMAAAIDWVLKRLKEGASEVAPAKG